MKKLNLKKYTDYIIDEAVKLISVDSPTGYTEGIADLVTREFFALGYKPEKTVKGGLLIKIADAEAASSKAKAGKSGAKATNGKAANDKAQGGLFLEAHGDTLGGMVSKIKGEGRRWKLRRLAE